MKKAKIKSNTKIQREIRKKKKIDNIYTVTLELKENEYAALQKISRFLAQGDIKPKQKKVIKTYSKLFNYLLTNNLEQCPKNEKSKVFYRRCSIAKFYKQTSGLNDDEIVTTLNNIKVKLKGKDQLTLLKPPQYYIKNKAKNKLWNIDNFTESLSPKFLSDGLQKLESQQPEKEKASNKK